MASVLLFRPSREPRGQKLDGSHRLDEGVDVVLGEVTTVFVDECEVLRYVRFGDGQLSGPMRDKGEKNERTLLTGHFGSSVRLVESTRPSTA